MNDQWWIAIFTNAIVILGALWLGSIRVTAKIGEINSKIGNLIGAHELKSLSEITAVRTEIFKVTHDFAETFSAMRQKINDVELYGSNHYVRREGLNDLNNSITALRAELRGDLLRMEQKIDQKT
jgi:hypothetical protein